MAVEIAEQVIAAKPLLVDQAMSVVKGMIDSEKEGLTLHPGQLSTETLSEKGIDVAWRITDKQHGADYIAMFAADIHHVVIIRQLPSDISQIKLTESIGLSRRGSPAGIEYFFNPSSGSSNVYQYGAENPFLQKIVDRIRE